MSGYKRSKTEIICENDPLTEKTKRIALCVAACEGVDESMLELLAKKDKDGITNLQHILNKVTWTGIPVRNIG